MANKPLCFLSYARADIDFIDGEIIPILNKLNIDTWDPVEEINQGNSLNETIIEGLKKCNLIICLLNGKSTVVNFEIGAAMISTKPVLAIARNISYVLHPRNQFFDYLYYNEDNEKEFSILLRNAVEILSENVIGKATFVSNRNKKIVGIQVDFGNDFEKELLFTLNIIKFIKEVTENPQISLLESSKGSLKSIISLDLKSWTELLEKIIFFIPELKKKKLDRLKVAAEIEKLNAETNKINTETNILQANALLNIVEQYQNFGYKIQIDNDLLITQNRDGDIIFKRPPRIE